jgi:hypothetical protein
MAVAVPVIHLKIINSDAEILFEGDVSSNLSLHDLAVQHLTPVEGRSYSLYEGAVKVPQTLKLCDLTDEPTLLLNASYKVLVFGSIKNDIAL